MKPEDLVIEIVEDDLVIAPRSYADGKLPVLIEVKPVPWPAVTDLAERMLKPLESPRPFAGPPESTNISFTLFDEEDED